MLANHLYFRLPLTQARRASRQQGQAVLSLMGQQRKGSSTQAKVQGQAVLGLMQSAGEELGKFREYAQEKYSEEEGD